jgi:hypothetical protein
MTANDLLSAKTAFVVTAFKECFCAVALWIRKMILREFIGEAGLPEP